MCNTGHARHYCMASSVSERLQSWHSKHYSSPDTFDHMPCRDQTNAKRAWWLLSIQGGEVRKQSITPMTRGLGIVMSQAGHDPTGISMTTSAVLWRVRRHCEVKSHVQMNIWFKCGHLWQAIANSSNSARPATGGGIQRNHMASDSCYMYTPYAPVD